MKKLKTTILTMTAALLMSPALLANPMTTGHHVTNIFDIDGKVQRVSDTGQFVEIKSPSGPSLEVPVRSLILWDGGTSELPNLEPGRNVTARMNPGVLSFGPQDGSHLWIMMDGKKFAKIDKKNLSDGFFDDDVLTVRLEDGSEMQASFEDLAKTDRESMTR